MLNSSAPALSVRTRRPDLLPASFEDGVELLLGFVVGGDLGFGEDGFELADEVGGGDDLLAEGAEEFGGSGVDHGDVHDGVARGVLHGDFGGAGEEGLEFGLELLPGGVLGFGAGEGVEAAGLDAVDELLGLAVGRDEVVPAAGDVGVESGVRGCGGPAGRGCGGRRRAIRRGAGRVARIVFRSDSLAPPLPPVKLQSIQNMLLKSGLRFWCLCKVLKVKAKCFLFFAKYSKYVVWCYFMPPTKIPGAWPGCLFCCFYYIGCVKR